MKLNRKGQAVIEMALSLPFIIWLIYYTINSYYALRTAQVGQKYAAMNLHQRLDHRAIFVVDGVERQLATKNFLAVQYQNADGGTLKRLWASVVNRSVNNGYEPIHDFICRFVRCGSGTSGRIYKHATNRSYQRLR
jgi:hypothetical protein